MIIFSKIQHFFEKKNHQIPPYPKSHENFLSKFIEIFKKVDKDQNGIIDENELTCMMALIDPNCEFCDIETDEILRALDPYQHSIITFSSCVTF